MEYNWKLLYAIDDLQFQRNIMFNTLAHIEQISKNYP